MKNFHFPLALWIALIAFAIEWLPQIAPNAPWLQTAVLVLTIAAKCVEVIKNELEAQAAAVRGTLDDREAVAGLLSIDSLRRMFFGSR